MSEKPGSYTNGEWNDPEPRRNFNVNPFGTEYAQPFDKSDEEWARINAEKPPAPSVPTSPPAGPAVSPEIDALMGEEFDAWWEYGIWKDSSTTNKIENPFKFDRIDAARAALREAHSTLQPESLIEMEDPKTGNRIPVSAKTVVESLRSEVARLQQEALTEEERQAVITAIESSPALGWPDFPEIRPALAKLRRISSPGSAHKEKE